MASLAQRLLIAMELGGVDRPRLIATCHVTPAAASKWFTGGSATLKAEHAFKIARLCGVDPEWLVTGRGKPQPLAVREPGPEFEAKHADLIRMYRRLPDEVRLPIRQLIETLAAAQREQYSSWVAHECEASNV